MKTKSFAAIDADIRAGKTYAQLKKTHGVSATVVARRKKALGILTGPEGASAVPANNAANALEAHLLPLIQHMRANRVSRLTITEDGDVELHRAESVRLRAVG